MAQYMARAMRAQRAVVRRNLVLLDYHFRIGWTAFAWKLRGRSRIVNHVRKAHHVHILQRRRPIARPPSLPHHRQLILVPRWRNGMASPTDFALKHSVATAVAIPATVAANWYLETLSPAGIALVFVLFLAAFNGIVAFFWYRKKTLGGE
jgi:hypothetical protein